jgi:hypothetical protein
MWQLLCRASSAHHRREIGDGDGGAKYKRLAMSEGDDLTPDFANTQTPHCNFAAKSIATQQTNCNMTCTNCNETQPSCN